MDEAWLSAEAACDLLGVKRATLYAYVSRGKVQTRPAPGGRQRHYLRDDLVRLAARRDARAGHTAVAAGALRWGEPVLDSALTSIGERGPRYLGVEAVELAARDVGFEAVAELLWGEGPAEQPVRWPDEAPRHVEGAQGHSAIESITAMVVGAGARDGQRQHIHRAGALSVARRLIALAAARSRPYFERHPDAAIGAPTVAEALLRSWSVAPSKKRLRLVNTALVLVADHELNPSSFAARVAASTGADLYACLLAALATLSGPKHGGMPARIDAVLAEIERADHGHQVLDERLRRGDDIPGFGHPLYPQGDPRFAPIYELAAAIATPARLRAIDQLLFAMRVADGPAPTLDVALVAAARALGHDADLASALFAVGRMAGWVAHALEQREAGFVLRPRARYVGP